LEEQDLKQTVKSTNPKPDLVADAPEVQFVVADGEVDLVGTVLHKHYKVLSLVGSGAMGKVYKAEHLLLNKAQAVKILHRHLVGDTASLQRFTVEAKAASSLRHDNLLTVTDYGVTDDKSPFIVMDYVDGISLADYLEKIGSLSIEDFMLVFTQVVKGLAHAHEKGVIHRDIKPSNIMLSINDGKITNVRIVDFGIAKILPNGEGAAQHLTQTGEIFGSPLYMSPEQCRGGEIDFRSDIYSLGCVMHEALTGHVPVKGENAVETLYKHMSETAPRISDSHPHLKIPTGLEDVIHKCMQNDREQRYRTAVELADGLANANLQDIIKRPPVPKRKSENRAALNKTIPVLGLAAIIFAGAFLYGQWRHDEDLQKQVNVSAEVIKADQLMTQAWRSVTSGDLKGAKSTATAANDLLAKFFPQGAKLVMPANGGALAALSDSGEKLDAVAEATMPKYAESCDQVGLIDTALAQATRVFSFSDAADADKMLKQAVIASAIDKSNPIGAGRLKYQSDLADLLLAEGKWQEADGLLTSVLDQAKMTVGSLSTQPKTPGADLLQKFARLYWGEDRILDAAKIDAQLRSPAGTNLAISDQTDFDGVWIPKQSDGNNGLRLTLKKLHDKVGETHVETLNGTPLHDNDTATAELNGPIGTVSWTSNSKPGTAKIVRMGDILLWKVLEKPVNWSGPDELILVRQLSAPNQSVGPADATTNGAIVTGGVQQGNSNEPSANHTTSNGAEHAVLDDQAN